MARLLSCLFVVLIALVLFSSSTDGSENNDEDQVLPLEVQVYEEAYAEWLSSIRFCCSFSVRSGRASTFEAGVRGEFDEQDRPTSSSVFRATGRMSKDGAKVRMAVNFDEGIQIFGGSDLMATNVSFDEMTDGAIQVRYEPAEGNENWGNSIFFVRRKSHLEGSYKAGD